MTVKDYPHITGVYGDDGENEGALAVHAVTLSENNRIIVGSPKQTPTLEGYIPNLGGFSCGPDAAEKLAHALLDAAAVVRADAAVPSPSNVGGDFDRLIPRPEVRVPLTAELANANEALGKVMLEMQRRRLMHRGSFARPTPPGTPMTDEEIGTLAANAFEAGAMALHRLGLAPVRFASSMMGHPAPATVKFYWVIDTGYPRYVAMATPNPKIKGGIDWDAPGSDQGHHPDHVIAEVPTPERVDQLEDMVRRLASHLEITGRKWVPSDSDIELIAEARKLVDKGDGSDR